MKKYNVAAPYIDKEDIKSVTDVLKSGWLSLGPKYQEFERKICFYTKSKYACAVSSGTAGLHILVKAIGLKEGDEVITTPFSFVASVNCLLYEKVKPVFVDIDELTFNMDVNKIEKSINSKTKAILAVHMLGQPADIDRIMGIARKHRLRVIEDACESLGSFYDKKMSGTFSEGGVYAFYPNKQMTTGEGGVVVTNNKKIHERCMALRNQGRGRMSDWLDHEILGYNYRMDEMSAALGVSQLKKINWLINQKRKIAERYNKNFLNNKEKILIPKIAKNRTHSWFVYLIRVPSVYRDRLIKKLGLIGIQTKPYFPAIHLQPYIKKMYKFKIGDFPIAEKVSSETIALPFYVGLKNKDIDYISNMVINELSKISR